LIICDLIFDLPIIVRFLTYVVVLMMTGEKHSIYPPLAWQLCHSFSRVSIKHAWLTSSLSVSVSLNALSYKTSKLKF